MCPDSWPAQPHRLRRPQWKWSASCTSTTPPSFCAAGDHFFAPAVCFPHNTLWAPRSLPSCDTDPSRAGVTFARGRARRAFHRTIAPRGVLGRVSGRSRGRSIIPVRAGVPTAFPCLKPPRTLARRCGVGWQRRRGAARGQERRRRRRRAALLLGDGPLPGAFLRTTRDRRDDDVSRACRAAHEGRGRPHRLNRDDEACGASPPHHG